MIAHADRFCFFLFFVISIVALLFCLLPSQKSSPGSHRRFNSPSPTTVHAFNFIARRLQSFLPCQLQEDAKKTRLLGRRWHAQECVIKYPRVGVSATYTYRLELECGICDQDPFFVDCRMVDANAQES